VPKYKSYARARLQLFKRCVNMPSVLRGSGIMRGYTRVIQNIQPNEAAYRALA